MTLLGDDERARWDGPVEVAPETMKRATTGLSMPHRKYASASLISDGNNSCVVSHHPANGTDVVLKLPIRQKCATRGDQ